MNFLLIYDRYAYAICFLKLFILQIAVFALRQSTGSVEISLNIVHFKADGTEFTTEFKPTFENLESPPLSSQYQVIEQLALTANDSV